MLKELKYNIAYLMEIYKKIDFQLAHHLFLRTGKLLPWNEIERIYGETILEAKKHSYSSALDFMKDFHGDTKTKTTSVQFKIPCNIKNMILKSKKNSSLYKRLTPKEKDQDNIFDYIFELYKCTDSGENIVDCSSVSQIFPRSGLRFDRSMKSIRNLFLKTPNKGKECWKSELQLYMDGLVKKKGVEMEDCRPERIAQSISLVFKAIQKKITETEDHSLISWLSYFKSRLYGFYVVHKK